MLLKHIKLAISSLIAIFIPVVAWAQELQNPLVPTGAEGHIDPNDILARVAGALNFAIGAVVLFWFVFGGYMILTAAGNSERLEKGKKTITYAVLGLVIVLGSYTILATIINLITGGGPASFISASRLIDPMNITGQAPAALWGGRALRLFVSGLGAVTLLMFVYGGFLWLTSAGNEEKITKSKKTLSYATVGLTIVIFSYVFLSFIYVPLYNLLGGKAPQVTPETVTLSPEKSYACFRKELGKNYGGACYKAETPSDCSKPRDNYQKGTIVAQFSDCSKVGACVQVAPPGNRYKNYVAAEDCQPGTNKGMMQFNPVNKALNGMTCPFDGTTAIDVNAGKPGAKMNYQCFSDVLFMPTAEWPVNDSWACIREKKANPVPICLPSNGKTPKPSSIYKPCNTDDDCHDILGNLILGSCRISPDQHAYFEEYACSEETASACKKETATNFAGQFFDQWSCGDVGICKLDYASHYQCASGVPEAKCKPIIFQNYGGPVPPWGCTPYEEINGKCYETQGITFEAGTQCPRHPNIP